MMFQRFGLGQTPADVTGTVATLQPSLPNTDQSKIQECFVNPLSMFDPSCWSVMYQQTMYGSLPDVPQAAASATPPALTTEQAQTMTPDEVQQYLASGQNVAAQVAAQQAISDSVAAGTYNPGGNLPNPLAPFGVDLSTTWIVIGVAVGAVVLIALAKR